MRWRALMLQIRYSPESILRAVALMAYCIFWLCAVNASWNSNYGYWNVGAHSVENPNRWNAGAQILSRYCFLSSAMAEVLLIIPFFNPPIIFPIFSISAPMDMYCLFETKCVSHKS